MRADTNKGHSETENPWQISKTLDKIESVIFSKLCQVEKTRAIDHYVDDVYNIIGTTGDCIVERSIKRIASLSRDAVNRYDLSCMSVLKALDLRLADELDSMLLHFEGYLFQTPVRRYYMMIAARRVFYNEPLPPYPTTDLDLINVAVRDGFRKRGNHIFEEEEKLTVIADPQHTLEQMVRAMDSARYFGLRGVRIIACDDEQSQDVAQEYCLTKISFPKAITRIPKRHSRLRHYIDNLIMATFPVSYPSLGFLPFSILKHVKEWLEPYERLSNSSYDSHVVKQRVMEVVPRRNREYHVTYKDPDGLSLFKPRYAMNARFAVESIAIAALVYLYGYSKLPGKANSDGEAIANFFKRVGIGFGCFSASFIYPLFQLLVATDNGWDWSNPIAKLLFSPLERYLKRYHLERPLTFSMYKYTNPTYSNYGRSTQ